MMSFRRWISLVVDVVVAVLSALVNGRSGASMKRRSMKQIASSPSLTITTTFLVGVAFGIVMFSYFSSGFVKQYVRLVCGTTCAVNTASDLGGRTITYAFLDWIFQTGDTSASPDPEQLSIPVRPSADCGPWGTLR